MTKKAKIYKDREYQFEYIDFNIKQNELVLDLGSGNHPFPLATHLVDLFFENDSHRGGEKLIKDKRPIFQANIEQLPFKDKEFNFVYCSHVLEHVNTPSKACREIMRVGKRGYIETPTRTSDIMFNYIYLHKWHISLVGNTLIFIPYSAREKKGTMMNSFEKEIHSIYENDFSTLVYKNRDLFCNMMLWENHFNFYIFNEKGHLVDSSK